VENPRQESRTNGKKAEQGDFVLPATRRAIRLTRVCLALPAPTAFFGVLAMMAIGPLTFPGLAEPQVWHTTTSYSSVYWLGSILGCCFYMASVLLQAYGKRPEVEQVDVVGTEKIFTWDAILELIFLLSTCVGLACLGVLTNKLEDNPAFLITMNFVTVIVVFVVITTFLKSIINTKRGHLTTQNFRAWAIKQAAVLSFGVGPLILFFQVFVFIVNSMHPMHHAHVDWSGSIFHSLSTTQVCTNESVTLAAIASIECGEGSGTLCGYDSWQTLCQRVQLAEGIRSNLIFCIAFPAHLVLMWTVIVLYSHGIVTSRSTGETKASYVHLFRPYMLAAGILLLYANLIEIYQLAQFFALSAFFMQDHQDKLVKLPGMCYGQCTTWITVSFAISWIAIVFILNFERLRSLFSQARERADEKVAIKEAEKDWDSNSPSFYFLPVEYVLGLSDGGVLPRFQELGDVVRRMQIPLFDSFRGRGIIRNVLFISHRWEEPGMPDLEGEQLRAIQAYLKGDSSIKWVWYDFSCMPQQDYTKFLETGGSETRTHAEKAEFNLMLKSITDLYLTSRVLILLDGSYDSRFWTLTESWCAMQQATDKGLHTAAEAERRYTIMCIHNATEVNELSLVKLLSKKSPTEMRRILAKPDVQVTNTKDKMQMLPVIESTADHVKAMMRPLDA